MCCPVSEAPLLSHVHVRLVLVRVVLESWVQDLEKRRIERVIGSGGLETGLETGRNGLETGPNTYVRNA